MRAKNKKACDGCYYGDKCSEHKVCEFYDPLDTYEFLIAEYRQNEKERAHAYKMVVDEFGGDAYWEN